MDRSDGAAKGSRGRDCVEPAVSAAARDAATGSPAARAEGGPAPGDSGAEEGGRVEAEGTAGADRAGAASGRVRAAAQVTPTEVTNSARIRTILNIE
ncbi:hypothetical protein GCM10010253_56840 [Streptomyces badius]|uniref:Uncharacterized protein n=1 Tax=Streptomyces badius TaxID=1941 RepID=A0ABQ2TK32_STRBA|nr:hypothetical protein GCM10010253_56840 [Streptomyces badius]